MRGGAFGISSEQERANIFARIPDDTDILITHGPPFGLLDQSYNSGEHIGCRQTLGATHRVNPLIHAFGHVHGAYGTRSVGGTLFVNAALADPDDEMKHRPIVLEIGRNRTNAILSRRPILGKLQIDELRNASQQGSEGRPWRVISESVQKPYIATCEPASGHKTRRQILSFQPVTPNIQGRFSQGPGINGLDPFPPVIRAKRFESLCAPPAPQ